MKSNDPNQLHVFRDQRPQPVASPPPVAPIASNDFARVQDLRDAAYANNQSLIRLQPGYNNQWGKSPWIIKQQSQGDTATGWTYLKKFDCEAEAKEAYATLLESGNYVEG